MSTVLTLANAVSDNWQAEKIDYLARGYKRFNEGSRGEFPQNINTRQLFLFFLFI